MRKLLAAFVFSLSLVLIFGGMAQAAPPPKIDVIIGFDVFPGPAEQSLVRSVGGDLKYAYSIVPAIAAAVPEAAIPGLLRNPRVTSIQPDITVQATDDTVPWGVARIGAVEAHQAGITGSGVKVAILDTGIDYTHPDLAPIYAGGYDFVNGDTDPKDDNGHGTHVAGTIAAVYNGAGVAGVAPGVEVYALKVLNRRGSGSFSSIIAALEWATGGSSLPGSIKVDITNNSYGSPVDPGLMVQLAFDLTYYSDGVLSVAAAGNSGTTDGTGDTVEYPGKYESVVAVAATDQSDARASFSSTGPTVELSAPGVSILSTYLRDSYATASGTSMASPHVVGTAALVIAAGINDANGDSRIADEVRLRLQQTADDLGPAGKDSLYGYGLVDADEAAFVPVAPNTAPIAVAGGPYTGTEDIAVFFDGSGSSDADGDTLTYAWDFGDGSTGTGVGPSHTYTAGGTYTVTLVVNDGKVDSLPSTITTTITEVIDPPAPSNAMHVSAIDMSLKRAGINTAAVATVTIVDANGQPVYGAAVYGHWSGPTGDSDVAITDSNGQVTLQSDYVKRAKAGTTFTFTIDNVELASWSYDPAANVETSDSVAV